MVLSRGKKLVMIISHRLILIKLYDCAEMIYALRSIAFIVCSAFTMFLTLSLSYIFFYRGLPLIFHHFVNNCHQLFHILSTHTHSHIRSANIIPQHTHAHTRCFPSMHCDATMCMAGEYIAKPA